jgi:hypothetical protein
MKIMKYVFASSLLFLTTSASSHPSPAEVSNACLTADIIDLGNDAPVKLFGRVIYKSDKILKEPRKFEGYYLKLDKPIQVKFDNINMPEGSGRDCRRYHEVYIDEDDSKVKGRLNKHVTISGELSTELPVPRTLFMEVKTIK